jgi:hypothetical protein
MTLFSAILSLCLVQKRLQNYEVPHPGFGTLQAVQTALLLMGYIALPSVLYGSWALVVRASSIISLPPLGHGIHVSNVPRMLKPCHLLSARLCVAEYSAMPCINYAARRM